MRPFAVLLLSLSPIVAQAQSPNPAAAPPAATVEVQAAWARATAPRAQSGGIFLTLTDRGPDDRLLGAATPVATTAELHETVDDHGIMRMRPVPGLPLATATPVTLRPGGLHIMLFGLQHPLVQGQAFPVTLSFEHAPPVTVTVTVGAPGAAGP